jgi:hypothetical protein
MKTSIHEPTSSSDSTYSVLSQRVATFGVCVLLLMLTPAIMILLFHIDGPELGRTGMVEFVSVVFVLVRMQIEPFLVALSLTAYAVFSNSVKSKAVWIVLALLGNALIGFFWMVVRSEAGF